jgi:cytoskeletal protein RodZ
MNDFGLFLKHERELRGIPLEEIANTTKIHMRYLTALDNNDYSEFPGEVFIKGYIRSYAKSIGTNVETILSAYEETVGKQRSESLQKAKSEEEKALAAKTALRRNIMVSIFVLAFALVGYFLTDIYRAISKSGPTKAGDSSSVIQTNSSESASSQSGTSGDMTAGIKPDESDLSSGINFQPPPELEPAETAESKPAATEADPRAGKAPVPPASTSTLPPTAPTTSAKMTKKDDKTVVDEKKNPQLNMDAAKESVVSSKVDNAGEQKPPLRLLIKATEDSWFNVTVDGSRKLDFTLSAGASKSLSGKNSFLVTIGNKNGAVLALNGRSLQLPASDDNVVRDFQITPTLIE